MRGRINTLAHPLATDWRVGSSCALIRFLPKLDKSSHLKHSNVPSSKGMALETAIKFYFLVLTCCALSKVSMTSSIEIDVCFGEMCLTQAVQSSVYQVSHQTL